MLIRAALFYLLTFVFTAGFAVIQQETGIVPWLILPQLAPGIAAGLMLLIYKKDRLKLTLEAKADQWRRYAIALILPFALMAVVAVLYLLIGDAAILRKITLSSGALILIGMFLGALGEEIGWRGYLTPLVNRKWRLLWAVLLTSLLWTLWHVQLYSFGALYMASALVAFLSYSLFMAFVMRGSQHNIFIAALFHFAINLSNSLFPMETLTHTVFMFSIAVVWGIAALVLVLRSRKLFRHKNA